MESINTNLTYSQFENFVLTLIRCEQLVRRLEQALDCTIECVNDIDSNLVYEIATLFPRNLKNYGEEFYDYWDSWTEMTRCAIAKYVWCVIDYDTLLPNEHDHELYTFESRNKVDKMHSKYAVKLSCIRDLWNICTGEIAIREKFA